MITPAPRPASSGARRALAVVGLALVAYGCGQVSPAVLSSRAPHRSRIEEERPPHPRSLDVATPAQERALRPRRHPSRARPASRPEAKPATTPAGQSPGSLPPASAGTNGSFVPPPSSEGKAITPRTMGGPGQGEGEAGAVLLSGIALAPPSAPEAVKAAISGANEIVGRPYIWGGGHRSWYSAGYDCSGSVSYALAAGGLLRAPLNSAQLEHWGVPGPGRWITVYANAGHAYAVIAGLRWDTVGDARGNGPRWHAALPYPEQFVARHPAGY